jgi:hypothetical protein
VVARATAHPVQVLENGQLVVQLRAQLRLHLPRQAGQRHGGGGCANNPRPPGPRPQSGVGSATLDKRKLGA